MLADIQGAFSMQSPTADQALATAEPQLALAQACTSLWLATLSLMTAYMHNSAPAHRYLLAKRIARNFATLRQENCFGERTQARFAKLEQHWQRTAARLSPEGEARSDVFTRLQRLLAR